MHQNIELKLIEILIDVSLFLEFSGDEIINQDAAVSLFENIASKLISLKEGDKHLLIEKIGNLSKNYPVEKQDFIKNLPANIGLV